jgi:transposase
MTMGTRIRTPQKQTVKFIQEQTKTVADIAEELNMPVGTLHQWVANYRQFESEPLASLERVRQLEQLVKEKHVENQQKDRENADLNHTSNNICENREIKKTADEKGGLLVDSSGYCIYFSGRSYRGNKLKPQFSLFCLAFLRSLHKAVITMANDNPTLMQMAMTTTTYSAESGFTAKSEIRHMNKRDSDMVKAILLSDPKFIAIVLRPAL